MIKTKLLKFCVVCMTAFVSTGFSEIHQVSKIEEIKQYTKELEPSDLAVFDIDMVLMQPEDPAFQMAAIYQHGKKLKEIMEGLTSLEKDIFLNLMVTSGESILVDDQMITIAEDLKTRKVKTMALTAGLTGSFGEIASMEEWRYNRLKKFGFNFSESFPEHHEILLTELPMYRGNHAAFKKGILFANGEKHSIGKGVTLKKFLEKVAFKPKKVIFIDDRLENLQIVEKVLKENDNVSFIGLHYVGAKHFPSAKVDADIFEKKCKALAHKARQNIK